MSPLAHLLLAAAVLHAACAASIPDTHSKLVPDLSDVEIKDPLDKEAAPEIVDQTSVINEVENSLRVKPADIPVQVVIEDSRPAINTNEVADNDEKIRRPAIDLRNPGPPQRQEHENQNADHFSEAQESLSTVRETILQTHNLLRQGVKDVGDDISNWLTTNEQMNAIQQNIQTLKESFTAQIQKLNRTIHGLAAPQASKPQVIPEQTQTNTDFKEVETSIKMLENNFNNGLRALSEGVSIVSILREEDASAAAASPGPTTPATVEAASTTPSGQNILYNILGNFQNIITESMNSLTNTLGLNRTTSTVAPGVLQDSADSTTQNPANNLLAGWPQLTFPPLSMPPFFQNFFINQGQQNQTTSRPILEQFQNMFNFGPTTTKPKETVTTGSNVVKKPSDETQPETPAAAAPPATAAPVGPIRQMLSNSPVVQNIAGTVQRIQSSINNPEKPRETEKSDDLETKGGFYGGYRPGGSGDNNNVNSGLKVQNEDPLKDTITEEIKEQVVVDKKEKNPEVVLEKTE